LPESSHVKISQQSSENRKGRRGKLIGQVGYGVERQGNGKKPDMILTQNKDRFREPSPNQG
jgi:hypothetical protein